MLLLTLALGLLPTAVDPGPVEPSNYRVDAAARSSTTFVLPAGPRTVRLLEVRPDPTTADGWRAARLRLIWESDEPEDAGFDLPLGLALDFEAEGSTVFVPVPEGFALRTSMPYRRSALLRIDADRPIRGAIRLLSAAGVEPEAAYFRARTVRRTAMVDQAEDTISLDPDGRGHFVGALLGAGGLRVVIDGRAPREVGPWHAADSIAYSRSLAVGLPPVAAADLDRGEAAWAALFWYADRPGPDRPAGP